MDISNNPYITTDGPKMKRSIVAFVDILGYKSICTEKCAEENLKKIHRALAQSREYVDPKHDTFYNPDRKDSFAFSAHSDSIIIGYPILHNLRKKEPSETFKKIARLQMNLALEGFFIRGGISIGEIYMDNIIVFGPAFIEAYEAEKNTASVPRIVLADSARTVINNQMGYSAASLHNTYLRKDVDDTYFIHYLDALITSKEYFDNGLTLHKTAIENKLKLHKNDPSVLNKYRWSAGYHNYYCNSYHNICDTMKVNVEDYSAPIRMVAEQ